MKKWLFCLVVVIMLGSIFLTACVAPDLNKEREISVQIIAVSDPFILNGIKVVTLALRESRSATGLRGTERGLQSQLWMVASPDQINRSEIERKNVELRYKVINADVPIVQLISIKVMN